MRCCRRDGIKAVLGTQEGGAGTLGFSLAVPGEPGRAGSGRFREVGFTTLRTLRTQLWGSLKLCCSPEGLLCMARAGDPPREWTPVRLFPSPDSALC